MLKYWSDLQEKDLQAESALLNVAEANKRAIAAEVQISQLREELIRLQERLNHTESEVMVLKSELKVLA